MRSTKYFGNCIVIVLAICALASAAGAVVDYQITATPSGGDWVYALKNNTADRYVLEFYLFWQSPIGGGADQALANANFDETTGYISMPTGWEDAPSYLNHPGFASLSATYFIDPGEERGGFKVHYIGGQLPMNALVLHSNSSQTDLQFSYTTIPEPGSIVSLLAGCAGCLVVLRRRR